MKKNHSFVAALFFILLTVATSFSLYIPKSLAANEEVTVIPNEAIRLRILANSNSERDQRIKREIRDFVNEQISQWVAGVTSLDEARRMIISHLDEIESISLSVLEKEGIRQSVQVDFGKVQFPTKLYGSFLYPAGTYEAVLITIGEGNGANWWCVLFPPLCFLDFSSGSAVSDGSDRKEKPAMKESEAEGDNEKGTKNSQKNGETVFLEEKEEKVEVTFFLVEIFEKILSIFK